MLRRSLILAFLVLFVLEIFVIVQVGGAIGFGLTFLALIAGSVLGGWVIRREGGRAWRALQQSVMTGTPPERELADAAVVMAGGLLLVVPGFITDVLGLLLVLPFTRPLVRRLSGRLVERQLRVGQERLQARVGAYSAESLGLDGLFPPHTGAAEPEGQVIKGTIVREDRPEG